MIQKLVCCLSILLLLSPTVPAHALDDCCYKINYSTGQQGLCYYDCPVDGYPDCEVRKLYLCTTSNPAFSCAGWASTCECPEDYSYQDCQDEIEYLASSCMQTDTIPSMCPEPFPPALVACLQEEPDECSGPHSTYYERITCEEVDACCPNCE